LSNNKVRLSNNDVTLAYNQVHLSNNEVLMGLMGLVGSKDSEKIRMETLDTFQRKSNNDVTVGVETLINTFKQNVSAISTPSCDNREDSRSIEDGHSSLAAAPTSEPFVGR
jgi:hypothetical protein